MTPDKNTPTGNLCEQFTRIHEYILLVNVEHFSKYTTMFSFK